MAYITVNELREAAAPNGVYENTAGELTDLQLEDVIRQAEEKVNAYTSKVYTGEPVPYLIKSMTIGVALYLATLEYRQGRDIPADDPVVRRYAYATRLLDDIADGTIDPPLDAGVGGAEEGETVDGDTFVLNPYEGRLFTRVPEALWGGEEYGERAIIRYPYS